MMKAVGEMTQAELGAYVQTRLRSKGIDVVLSGGAAVSIYTDNRYASLDLDMVNVYAVRPRAIREVMLEIGFREEGRHFVHPQTPYFVEFPSGPLAIGEEPIKRIDEISLSTGVLRVISPTDCVKDRLAAFYFWEDRQSLRQAVWVAQAHEVDLDDVRRWSLAEGKLIEYEKFLAELQRGRGK